MTDLDSQALRAQLDPDGSYERNRGLPEQCQEAWHAVRGLSLPKSHKDVRNVIVTGMGGSAIAGDFVQALAFTRSPLPISVVRGSHLPLWAGPDTLVIACSHSGNTEETLSAFRKRSAVALDRSPSRLVASSKSVRPSARVPSSHTTIRPSPAPPSATSS